MKKRIAVGVGLLVLVCTGATLLDPYCRLLGLVRRESFYQGKPTIYWERQIAGADERARTGNGNSNFIFDWIEKRTGYSIGNSQPDLDVLRIDSAAIPVLRELLKSSVAYVRWNAAIVLCAHDEEADDAVGEVLGEVLTCHNKYVLRGHMFSFNFGSNAFIIAPSYPPDTSWKEFTLSRSGEVASAPLTWNDVVSESSSNCASGVLRMVNELGPRGTPVLIRAIGQEDCKVREGVATLLGERRSEAATVIPVLRSALSDPSVRLPVAAALKKLDPG